MKVSPGLAQCEARGGRSRYIHSLLRVTTLPSRQVEFLKQEAREKEADFLAQEAQLLEDLEAAQMTEQQLRASLRALEAKAAQVQLRLRGAETRLAALAAEQQPGHQAQAQLASLCSVLQQALGFTCDGRPELRGGGDSASLWGPEAGKTAMQGLGPLGQSHPWLPGGRRQGPPVP